jgi:GDP-4-dehydro-6-deoxy-D-mannose reductase
MDIIRIRCFNLSGPGQSPKYALSSFAKQIVDIEKGMNKDNIISVGNLNVERDYTDVRDAVRAYYEIALNAKAGSVYNLCSGISYNMKELLHILLSLSTKEIIVEIDNSKMRPSDIPIMVGNNQKIREEIGWEPEIKIKNTLLDLIEYWRAF